MTFSIIAAVVIAAHIAAIGAAAGLTAASAVFLWRNASRDTNPPKDDDWSEW